MFRFEGRNCERHIEWNSDEILIERIKKLQTIKGGVGANLNF